MFRLRREHIEAFKEEKIKEFREEFIDYCRSLEKIDSDEIAASIFDKALAYHFKSKQGIYEFLKLNLYFGFNFEELDKFKFVSKILNHPTLADYEKIDALKITLSAIPIPYKNTDRFSLIKKFE